MRILLSAALLIAGTMWTQTKGPDPAGIADATQSFVAAWNRGDAKGISESFAMDGSLVIPQGLMIQGRAAIEGFYQDVFTRGYRGSRAASSIKRIRNLREDVAVVDGEWSIEGAHDAGGNPREAERGIFFAVLVRNDGKWLITALREQTSATEVKIPGS